MQDKILFISAGVFVVVVSVLIFLFGLGRDGELSQDQLETQTATAVPFTKLAQGASSSVPTRTNYLITSSSQLNTLWGLIDVAVEPPEIDFTTHAVIAVFAGDEPSTAIEIAKIQDTDARLVSIRIAKPESACVESQSALSPYEIVAVPVTSLPFEHQDSATVVSCWK